MSATGTIAVDLDGTLAHYDKWIGSHHIGAPVPRMVERVRQWLAEGKRVVIFTARMHSHGLPIPGGGTVDVEGPIKAWCREHIGQELPVTNVKDFNLIELWDDRAVQVIPNTGETVQEKLDDALLELEEIKNPI